MIRHGQGLSSSITQLAQECTGDKVQVLVAGAAWEEATNNPVRATANSSWLHKPAACHPPTHPVYLRKGEAASSSKCQRKHRRRLVTGCSKRHREAWRRDSCCRHSWRCILGRRLHTGAGTSLKGPQPVEVPMLGQEQPWEAHGEDKHGSRINEQKETSMYQPQPPALPLPCPITWGAKEKRRRKEFSPSLCLSSGLQCVSLAKR